MFKRLAALVLAGVAVVGPAGNATAQRLHFGDGHRGHGHDHHGHNHGHGHIRWGGIGLGYWPSFSNYYSPGWTVWPTYGSYYSYPSAYYLGSVWPAWGTGVTSVAPQTTIVNMPNVTPVANTQVVEKPVDIQFGGFAQVGELATRLVQQANDLCLDLHHNYPRNDGFADTYRAAYQIFDTAKFVSGTQDDRQEIARRVNELDALFHQVRTDVRRFRRRAVERIAGTSLQTKLNEVESTLHDLMADVGVMGTHGAPLPPAAPADALAAPMPQVAPPPALPAPNPPGGN